MPDLSLLQDWKAPTSADDGLERVVGHPDFQEPWFLDAGASRAKAVCLLPRAGTGFLIATDVIITNNHVLPSKAWADGVSAYFGYEVGPDGLAKVPVQHQLSPESLFHTNKDLDFSIVRVKGEPGKQFGAIELGRPGKVALKERANIVQHPGAGLKKIAIRNNEIRFFDGRIIQYLSDTEHGSSGSPVFDDGWDIIGLHYRFTPDPTNPEFFFNEAKDIKAIWAEVHGRI